MSNTKDSVLTHWFLNLLISTLLIGFSYQNRLNWLSTPISLAFSPLRSPIFKLRQFTQKKLELINQLPHQQRIITDLKRQNAQLATQAQNLQDLQSQNQHLKELLNSPLKNQAPLLPAQITGLSRYAYLNKGSSDHIQPGYAVVSGSRLLGIIHQTNPHTSSLQLLTDIDLNIPVKTQANQTGRLVFKNNQLTITQVSPDPALKKDQPVFTQGTPLIPPNLIIGTISQVKPAQSDIYQSATLTPSINPKTQLQVAVILYQLQP